MNKFVNLRSFVLGTVVGTIIVLSVGAATSGARNQPMEYKVVTGKAFQNELERAINSAAVEGWELVSASPYVEQFTFAVLKRERK